MKVAVTVTGVFEVPAQPVEQVTRLFRVANESLVGRPIQTATGQVWTMVAIEQLDVVERDARPRSFFTCPRCGRTSTNPNDIAQRYCGACHRFVDS